MAYEKTTVVIVRIKNRHLRTDKDQLASELESTSS